MSDLNDRETWLIMDGIYCYGSVPTALTVALARLEEVSRRPIDATARDSLERAVHVVQLVHAWANKHLPPTRDVPHYAGGRRAPPESDG